MTARAPRDAGFTLVEMLVSLALLGMAALLLVQGFSSSRGAWRRIATREQASESVTVAQTQLRSRLEQMIVRARFDADRPFVEMEGGPEQLDFLSGPPLGEPAAPAASRRLRLTDAGALELETLDAQGAPEAGPDVLLRRVAKLELAYWGRDGGSAAAGWRDAWAREPGPPELVRVRVEFPPGDRRVWPELVARLAADVDGQCVIDGDSGTCRGRT